MSSKWVAYYFVAVAISKLSWLITDASGNILYPKFIKITDKETEQKAIDELYFYGTLNFLINILAIIVFYFIGRFVILLIYEDSYLVSYVPTLILLLGSQGMAYYKLIGRYLASKNEWNPMYLALGIAVIFNISFNIIVLKFTTYGIIGVAASSAVSYWICGLVISYFLGGSFRGFMSFRIVIVHLYNLIKLKFTRS